MDWDVIIALTIVPAGVAYCELGIESKLVNWFSDFIQKPVGVMLLLFAIVFTLFYKVIDPDYVMFSNDGPYGTMVSEQSCGTSYEERMFWSQQPWWKHALFGPSIFVNYRNPWLALAVRVSLVSFVVMSIWLMFIISNKK